jgi:hypothetical protein
MSIKKALVTDHAKGEETIIGDPEFSVVWKNHIG